MRKKFLMPSTDPAAEDTPYVLIDVNPSVKMNTIMLRRFADLRKDFEVSETDEGRKFMLQVEAGAGFLTTSLACGIAKIGGNWDLYLNEWGESSPAWPRVIRSDVDMEARLETASNIDQKTASAIAEQIQGFMHLSEDEEKK